LSRVGARECGRVTVRGAVKFGCGLLRPVCAKLAMAWATEAPELMVVLVAELVVLLGLALALLPAPLATLWLLFTMDNMASDGMVLGLLEGERWMGGR